MREENIVEKTVISSVAVRVREFLALKYFAFAAKRIGFAIPKKEREEKQR